jgi:hypothetical protein
MLALMIGAVLLCGCSAHQPPADGVTLRIKAGVIETLTAMALPAEQQPQGRILDDQSRLLACRLSPERISELDRGVLDRQAIMLGYANALKRRVAKRSKAEAPALLVFLIEKTQAWSANQTMLAAALLVQFEQEARLQLETTGLAK